MDVESRDIGAAVAVARRALTDGLEMDWSVPAHGLDLDCAATIDHIADCLSCYAVQLTARATDGFVPCETHVDSGTPNTGYLTVLEVTAQLLAGVVARTPSSVRAYHSWGMSDAAGFAVMGITEILAHTYDVCAGLGVPGPAPSNDMCQRVLDRLFPEVAPHPDAWLNLLWATGRADLPGRTRRTSWRWQAAPPGDSRFVVC